MMNLFVCRMKKRLGGQIYMQISLNFGLATKEYMCLSDLAPSLEFWPLGMLICWQLAVSVIPSD
jgi:hypothetical protein